MAWTTADLLTEVRRLAMLPSSSNSATADADILAQADRAMQISLVPLLLSTQEEYLVRSFRAPIPAGFSQFPLPTRAIGARIRALFLIKGNSRTLLPRIRPEELQRFAISGSSSPAAFYLDGSDVCLVPGTASGETIEMALYLRPGRFTASTNHRTLTTVNPDTNYLGAASPGRTRLQFSSGISVATLGPTIDIISNGSPFPFHGIDVTYNSAGGTVTSIDIPSATATDGSIIFGANNPVTSGDLICPVNESSYIQLPVELHPLLFQRTAQFLLAQLGFQAEAAMAKDMADSMEASARVILSPRTDGNPQKLTGGALELINRNALGLWRW